MGTEIIKALPKWKPSFQQEVVCPKEEGKTFEKMSQKKLAATACLLYARRVLKVFY